MTRKSKRISKSNITNTYTSGEFDNTNEFNEFEIQTLENIYNNVKIEINNQKQILDVF